MNGLRFNNASDADRLTYDGVKDMLKRGTFVAIEGDVLLIAPSEVELNAKIVGRNPPLTHKCYVTCVGYEDVWAARLTPSPDISESEQRARLLARLGLRDPTFLSDEEYLREWSDKMADLPLLGGYSADEMQLLCKICYTRNSQLSQQVPSDPTGEADVRTTLPMDVDLFRVNEQAFERATDLLSHKWYAFDLGHRVAGPSDTMPDLYGSARAAGVELTVNAYVAQKDNPRSAYVVIR